MKLYRGISVPSATAGQVADKIVKTGIQPGDGRWTMLAGDLKPQLEDLWKRSVLTTAETKSEDGKLSWVCACAEPEGASYYACKHNRSPEDDTPLLIAFDADPADVIIDGRDFLYPLFQIGDPVKARPIAERVFGSGILRYLDRAWSLNEQNHRIALCDLAVQDASVICAHAENLIVVRGRYNVTFRSAFLVRAPVQPIRIMDVSHIKSDFDLPVAEIDLNMIR